MAYTYIYMWAALGSTIWDRSFFIFSMKYFFGNSFGNSNKLSLKCAVLQILSVSQRPGPGREAQSQLPSPGPQTKKTKKKKQKKKQKKTHTHTHTQINKQKNKQKIDSRSSI